MHHLHSSISSPSFCCFCICMSEAPEHILISRFHISALPAAPSLAAQPRFSVWQRAHASSSSIWMHMQNRCPNQSLHLHASFHVLQTCESISGCNYACICASDHSIPSLVIMALLPPAVRLKNCSAWPKSRQTPALLWHLSGWAHPQFSERIKCSPSLILDRISEWKEKIYRSFSCPRRKRAWIIYCVY